MLELAVNASDVVATLDNLAARQIPFATARALNQTALDFQVAQRVAMHGAFTIRRQSFIEKQGVKLLSGWATKVRPTVTIGMDPKADFLAKFELGGEKISIGGGLIAVPMSVARDGSGVIPDLLRPRFLFSALGSEVFIIRPGDSKRFAPGIYQRIRTADAGAKLPYRKRKTKVIQNDKAGTQLRMLYALLPDVHVSAILNFEATARRVVSENWAVNFEREFVKALQSARDGSGVPFDATPLGTVAP